VIVGVRVTVAVAEGVQVEVADAEGLGEIVGVKVLVGDGGVDVGVGSG
jgi:hypothetical protein